MFVGQRMDPPLDPTNIIMMRTIGIRLLHETRTFNSQWAQIAQSAPNPGLTLILILLLLSAIEFPLKTLLSCY